MKYIYTIIFFFFVSISLPAQDRSKPAAQTLPKFQFSRLNGITFTDKDIQKNKLIFIMFFDPECDHCQRAIRSIGEQHAAFKKTAMILISVYNKDKIDNFMSTYGSKLKGWKNITLLQDKLNQFILKFNPMKYPSMFLYTSSKKLIKYSDVPEEVPEFVKAINKNTR